MWPKEILDESKALVHGLSRMKQYVARWREGFSGRDMLVLKSTLLRWCRIGRRVQSNEPHIWDERLTQSFLAAIEFAHGETFRFGEATTPDGDAFDPVTRLSRDSVSVSRSGNANPDVMSMAAPGYKSTNRFQGQALTMEIHEDDVVNWPSAVERLLRVDPVDPAKARNTPLFRDTRYCRQLRNGLFASGGNPLSPRFVRKILRDIVGDNRDWFGTRLPTMFGVHSFRIGAMNDYLDAGVDYFEISALGRWTSSSVMDYHRMRRSSAHAWKRKALHQSLSALDRPAAEADVSARVMSLRAAMRARALPEVLFAPAAVARPQRVSRQTSLLDWARSVRMS